MKKLIYLDYASTTPVDKRVLKKMNDYFTINGIFGNPSSYSNIFGIKAKNAVEKARSDIANIIGSKEEEIIFTASATESINLAIKGIITNYSNNYDQKNIITSISEHKAVLETCNYMKKLGIKIIYLKNSNIGSIDLNILEKKITNNTILISIMHINNEIGTINNIKYIGNICKQKNIIFHVDATQSIGKYKLNLKKINIDLLSFSAHKFYGPKGIGVLYIRNNKKKFKISPLIHGGGQEKGIRSGTLAVHQIIGMAKALNISVNEIDKEKKRIKKLKKQLWDGIKNINGIYINGDFKNSSPYIINIGIKDIFNKILMMEMKNIAISSSSACISNTHTSHVLKSLGLTEKLIQSSIRFSFGRFTTKKEIYFTIKYLHFIVKKIRKNI
ncbi:aminotransferase class V-fold PLP-dependent enzyme [Enterobacteriaceae endosymbiont of Donacia versicolorea]|uniref:cysteine desulfurase family protein n=1 Tax=Enterobacteriaceae endosymbiont of Donacia versicolorea TaxID=2675788 RepID=UPI001449C74D|nr:aminotransferase class V-fold PLP-dependent enzyme [Enterobacteriaceae endosymbiont of Donacia versicolorea]QJC32197.1 aminotransferase class V-fold PLP-dependent enzyme [Enterobacteriaceae endosymbiont of Donacia versicolorea]